MARLRGRETELTIVGEHLAAVAGGASRTLTIEGPPGIGKTALLTAVEEAAREAGLRILRGAVDASQRTAPFGPLRDAVLSADPPVGDAEFARLARDPARLRYWIFHDVEAALEAAAHQSPLAVLLDDLQWADSGTWLALDVLRRRIASAPILWVLTLRSGHTGGEVADDLRRLVQHGAYRLDVRPLGDADVDDVIADALDAPADPALTRLARRAGGNPFLLRELLAGLREEARLEVSDGRTVLRGDALPARIRDSMEQRLARLPSDARTVVAAASVLGPRFSVAEIAAVLGRAPATLAASVEQVLGAELLVQTRAAVLAFPHELVRQAVEEALDPELRKRLQRAAVDVLLAAGADPTRVALQIAKSAEAGDGEAVRVLRAAARALVDSDVGAAAELGVRALDLAPADDPGRPQLVAETLWLMYSAFRPEEARELGEAALAGGLAPEQEAEVRLSLSSSFMRTTANRAEQNRRALALDGISPVLRARHAAWLVYHLATYGQPDEADRLAPGASEAARVTGDSEARTMTELGLVCVDAARGRLGAALGRLTALGPLERDPATEPYKGVIGFHRANVLADLGRLPEAMQVVAQGMARGRRERNSWLLETWSHYGALLRLQLGELADARAEAQAGTVRPEDLRNGYLAGLRSLLALAEIGARTGDMALAERAAADAGVVAGSGSEMVRRAAHWVLAEASVAVGNAREAARHLREGRVVDAVHFLPGYGAQHPAIARVALQAGDEDLAESAAAAAERIAAQSPGVPLLAGAAAVARGLVDRDPARLAEGVERLRESARPLLFADAARDAAAALPSVRAVPLLQAARTVYLDAEATADERAVEKELDRHGVAPDPAARRPTAGWPSLTRSEIRVLRLVAAGVTDRDAAAQLSLSPQTVASHVGRALAKLGLRSRVELANAVLAHDAGEEVAA